LRQERLRGATWKKGLLFLDFFSGKTSPMGRQVGKRGGAYISFDVLIDAAFDLANVELQGVVLRWIRNGFVWGVWLGTDCTTWSTASYSKGPGWFNSYRSQRNLWGELAELTPKAKKKVLEGNSHALFSIRVLQEVAHRPLAVAGLENPAGSAIWKLPALEELGEGSRGFCSTCHYCQFGTRWKKPTKFLFIGAARVLAPSARCKAVGRCCSKTKLPHLKLGQGRCHPSSGKLLTRLAMKYPPKLVSQLMECMAGGSKAELA
jgi:hypothetical protein